MDKEKLALWVEKLTAADKKDRKALVAEMCRENGIGVGDAWKLLKEAGFDAKAAPVPPADGAGDGPKADGEKVSVVLRHRTEFPKYRRAGLVLTRTPATYEVTAEQLSALKKDAWVEFAEEKKAGAGA
ncbi:MAG: hypothetical protein MdMp014T_2984 [Treponematales bacterium]